MQTKAEQLIQLARVRFKDLSAPERTLLQKVADGEEADYSAHKGKYHKDRILRSSLLAWLCTDVESCKFITHRGLGVIKATIKGSLNLRFATLDFPLIFNNCYFIGAVNLEQSTLKFIDLSGSQIISGEDISFELANAKVEGCVLLGLGFQVHGKVSLYNATVGSLECDGGVFSNPGNTVIYAEGIRVRGSSFFRNGFKSNGEISLSGATIDGGIYCEDGSFNNTGGIALDAQNAQISEDVFLCNNFNAIGKIWMTGISIGGNLDCSNGKFQNIEEAFVAENAQIKGDILLREEFNSIGEVSLSRIKIDGNLDCTNGFFNNPNGIALISENSHIGGNVLLRNGFVSNGSVQLSSTLIKGSLECDSGVFNGSNDKALIVENSTVNGNVYLSKDFQATGIVNFSNTYIENVFELRTNQTLCRMILVIRFTRIRTLSDLELSWPQPDCLLMNGLIYDRIAENSPVDYKLRLKWLRLQPANYFSLQPYEQLAKVLREGGHEDSAKDILIAKRRDLRKYKVLNKELKHLSFYWLKDYVLEHTVAYGYKPFQVLPLMAYFIMIGTFIFAIGYSGDPKLITPANKIDPFNTNPVESTELSEYYPRFNAIIYSLDTFVPIVNLRQQEYWLPNATRKRFIKICSPAKGEFIKIPIPLTGSFLRWYMWLHIVVGWVLTSLFVAGLTGLVRRIN